MTPEAAKIYTGPIQEGSKVLYLGVEWHVSLCPSFAGRKCSYILSRITKDDRLEETSVDCDSSLITLL